MKNKSQVIPAASKVDEVNEKANFLYDYAVQIHKEKLEKYRRLEDKAMKLLTIISVIITVLIFLLRSYKDDIFSPYKYDFMTWVVCGELLLVSIILCCAWGHILASITTRPLKVLSSDGDGIRNFIMSSDLAFRDAKIAIAKKIFENTKQLSSFHEEKAKFVKFAEEEIAYSGIIFIVFVITVISFHFSV
ncbi:hypothetical protein [Morganella psychrotolerans]|uniref:hypothetical protein n=1 Tax=Morganella psychrotolerans TaxID=368603 RepID=UPI0039B02689